METNTEFITAQGVQRNCAEQLEDVLSKISALDKIHIGLVNDINEKFNALVQSIGERQSLLLKELDAQMSTTRSALEDASTKLSANVRVCKQLIDTAGQVYPLMPDVAVATLQPLKSILPVSTTKVPVFEFVMDNNVHADIARAGELLKSERFVELVQAEHIEQQEPQVEERQLMRYESPKAMPSSAAARVEHRVEKLFEQLYTHTTEPVVKNAMFNNLYKITFNPRDGCCYVADFNNHKICKMSPDGDITTFAGTGEAGWSDGPCATAKFNFPTSVAINHTNGNIYVCDYNNHRIRKITPKGTVSTFAGSGKAGLHDGNSLAASFNHPESLDINQNDGCVYVADCFNHRIRKITPQGRVSTVAGTSQGFADGGVRTAKFSNPYGLCVQSATGEIFIADYNNHRIRRIVSGVVSTVAGTGARGSTDGDRSVATFNNPYDVDIDPRDNSLMIADNGGNKIRKISKQGVVSTVFCLNEDSTDLIPYDTNNNTNSPYPPLHTKKTLKNNKEDPWNLCVVS